MNKKFFITTPIFYVNNSPHLGHLYTAIIADVAQRFQKLQGKSSILFSTGTDEHGMKVERSSKSVNISPLKFCDSISSQFRSVFDNYSIQYSDYIRTTEQRHKDCVAHFFKTIDSRGYIYKAKYEGWYCVSDETFLTDTQIQKETLKSGEVSVVSKESGHPAEWNSETNYMFKMSQFQDDLLYWLSKENKVVPTRFQEELKVWLSSGLYDLSISRPKSRVSWGIPVPGDDSHTIYVWLDALANYLTVAGYPNTHIWPPSVQVIGKDILRFHGIYWPALLIAAGIEPPEKLLVHSHWMVDGTKMSKSIGNVICPQELSAKFSVDAVRYVILRLGVFHSDGSWSEKHMVECANAELANTLGNLLSRCLSPALNPSQSVPLLDETFMENPSPTLSSLMTKLKNLPEEAGNHFSNYDYYTAIETIMDMARTANLFIEEEKPWKLKANPDRTRLEAILYIGMVAIRAAAITLQPVVPRYSERLLDALNIPEEERMWHHLSRDIHTVFKSSNRVQSIMPFERIKIS